MSLVCTDVKKNFGKVVALKSVSLTIERGEVRAILGGNGSGKSTLTKIIGGIVSKNSGEITLDGKDYYCKSPQVAKKKKIVITSQELSLLHNLSVAENLCLCDLPTKGLLADKKVTRKIAYESTKKFGLEHLLNKNIAELAPNEKYMIEFVKALIQKPEILVIDEITSALFKQDVEKVAIAVRELKQTGCIILFITHRMPELYMICDSVTVMRNGESIITLPMKDAKEEELLSYMTGRDIKEEMAVDANESKVYEENDNANTILEVEKMQLNGFAGNVSFKLHENEVIGVAGLQGHGQSTLVRQLFGLYGSVDYKYEGKNVTTKNVTEAVRNGFAFVSGDREKEGAFGERSLAENASAVSYITLKQKKKDVDKLLRSYNVVFHNTKQTILELSGGNQQKVILSRWTNVNPKVFLADDPTKGIDVQARREVHKILYSLAEQGSGVIMVSSDDKELVDLTRNAKRSKVIVMYEGQISAVLVGDKITEDNISLASMNMYKEV